MPRCAHCAAPFSSAASMSNHLRSCSAPPPMGDPTEGNPPEGDQGENADGGSSEQELGGDDIDGILLANMSKRRSLSPTTARATSSATSTSRAGTGQIREA